MYQQDQYPPIIDTFSSSVSFLAAFYVFWMILCRTTNAKQDFGREKSFSSCFSTKITLKEKFVDVFSTVGPFEAIFRNFLVQKVVLKGNFTKFQHRKSFYERISDIFSTESPFTKEFENFLVQKVIFRKNFRNFTTESPFALKSHKFLAQKVFL